MLPGASAGAVWRYNEQHRKPEHFHGQLEFILVLRGRAEERIGNQVHAIHAGQLIWHLPSIPHQMLSASSDLDLRVVQVEPDVATALSQENQTCPLSVPPPLRVRRWDQEGQISTFSDWVRDLGWLATSRPVIELRRQDIDRLLDDCDLSFAERPPTAHEGPRLMRLLRNAWSSSLVNTQGSQGSSLAELACCLLLEDPSLDRSAVCRALDVSEGYLSRCFGRQLNTTFAAQRSRIRVARFASHVEREQQNILQAALSAGFGSYSQLHRTFCQTVGMTPVDYFRYGGRQARALLTAH